LMCSQPPPLAQAPFLRSSATAAECSGEMLSDRSGDLVVA
jgi:hypothetical protein